MAKKLTSTHWEARWRIPREGEVVVCSFTKGSAEQQETDCKLYAMAKARELGRTSSHDAYTKVSAFAVETWEEELGVYTNERVLKDLSSVREAP